MTDDPDRQPPWPNRRLAGGSWTSDASNPALNPLEHPVYDVWVIDCRS